MNLKRAIPNFFVKPRNTLIQILFTTLFAYAFILLYHPFGSQAWFDLDSGRFAFFSGALVALGMAVVIISRVIMTQIRKWRTITFAGYALMIFIEIVAMTGFFMMIQKVFLKDPRFWFEIYYLAIQNASLILLIPYLISLLYFAWEDKKANLDKLMQEREGYIGPRFVPFHDENGELRVTLNLDDLLYLEASENYVVIHHLNNRQPDRTLLRNSMKRLEQNLSAFPVTRCHRSYMVNIEKIRMAKKIPSGYVLVMNSTNAVQIPVSETYKSNIIHQLK